MRAWAVPVIDGVVRPDMEVEVETIGTSVAPTSLPWSHVSFRYEYEDGEEVPVVSMTRQSVTEEVIDNRNDGFIDRLMRSLGWERR